MSYLLRKRISLKWEGVIIPAAGDCYLATTLSNPLYSVSTGLSEPLAAITLSRVSPEQELLLVPIDGAITLASYGAEFENVFSYHIFSFVT